MPIYEYHCEQCGRTTEVTHGISESKTVKCPTCKKKMKRIISLNAFHLKGGGWYKSGYSKTAPASEKKTAAVAGAETKSAAAPESKTAAVADKKNGGGVKSKASE